MKERKIRNLPASIRQRLLQVARDSERPFQEVLQLVEVTAAIAAFLSAPAAAIRDRRPFTRFWHATGPWVKPQVK